MPEVTLQLDDAGGDGPRYLRIAQAVIDAARRGRLRAGAPLPSTRDLAAQLDVHRKTVTAAYRELARQGWITIARARGARISEELPDVPLQRGAAGPAVRAGFDLPPPLAPPSRSPRRPRQLLLLGGLPDLAAAPRLELGRAYRGVLTGRHAPRLLDYADPRGDEVLRAALADYLGATRGLHATADTIAVLRGCQQALYLAARTLLRAGDRVAVETPGYPPAWAALRAAGLELEPVPVDAAGLDTAALAALCARRPIRALYVTPHHQHPTTVTMTAARRVALLALAHQHRLLVLEDDYDHEFRYEGQPVLPLASADRHGLVCYLGTLSKVFAPGLRLGYIAATADVIDRIARYRTVVDQQGDHVLERAIAELVTGGALERHVRRARRVYRARRDALCEALARALPGLVVRPPHGGVGLWLRAPGVDVEAWVERAAAEDVVFQPGSRFAFDGRRTDFARLGFGACTERELVEAVRRLAACLPRRRR